MDAVKYVSADFWSECGNCAKRICSDYRREFWMQEVK